MASPPQQNRRGLISSYLSQRTTMPLSTNATQLSLEEVSVSPDAPTEIDTSSNPNPLVLPKKLPATRLLAVALVLILAIGLYLIWSPAPTTSSTPSIMHHNVGNSTETNQGTTDAAGRDTTASGNNIQVYIVGAVKHPGVYILPTNARVYQLLQAAGGPLPNANLVSLNLAARLSDGQEVYVTVRGEKPPSYVGGVPAPGSTGATSNTDLVNINTASAQEMQQKLHISSTTATTIINYRTQHGLYISVEQLAAVVSKSIYDKIKGQVTV